jgi:hypothetical protein
MNSHKTCRVFFLPLAPFAALFALAGCGGSGEGTGSTKQPETCDRTLVCGQTITCVDGEQYPTTCGPANCDAPIGPCEGADAAADAAPKCDPTLVCGQTITCVDGEQYPTTCGPANCDKPIGPCEGPDAAPADAGSKCDPTLVCGATITCVSGQQYPTTCGPANCDKPIGPC